MSVLRADWKRRSVGANHLRQRSFKGRVGPSAPSGQVDKEMSKQGDFFSPATGAFVHSYKGLRLYIYEHRHFPYHALNPLVKSLLYEDARFLEGRYLFEVCERADEADLFVFPCDLNYFEHREEYVYEYLDHFQQHPERHLFFDHRDQPEPFPPQSSIRLKVSLHRKQVSDTLICIPYMEMVDNLFWYLLRPRTLKYDLSFIGERTDFRERMTDAVGQLVPSSYFRLRDSFYHEGYLQYNPCHASVGPPVDIMTKRSQREEFINITLQSRFVLALRGYGLNSFRFFEGLSDPRFRRLCFALRVSCGLRQNMFPG
jgi:hypothetical protein